MFALVYNLFEMYDHDLILHVSTTGLLLHWINFKEKACCVLSNVYSSMQFQGFSSAIIFWDTAHCSSECIFWLRLLVRCSCQRDFNCLVVQVMFQEVNVWGGICIENVRIEKRAWLGSSLKRICVQGCYTIGSSLLTLSRLHLLVIYFLFFLERN